MRPDRVFPSRIDAWLMGLVYGAALLPFGLGLWFVAHGQTKGVVILLGWGGVISTLVFVLSWPLRYTFRADHLHIRSGQLEWSLPYATLRGASLSSNPLSAPAWSLRRVRLDQSDGGFILVSPDDRESFISELAGRCPHLVRNGSGLVSRPAPP